MGIVRASLVLALHFLAACAAPPPIRELPAFSSAMAIVDADAPRHPKLFVKGTSPAACFDDLVPYAEIRDARNLAGAWTGTAIRLADRLIRVMPDAFCYAEGAPEVAGVVTTHIAFGVSSGSTVQFAPVTLQACRIAPSRMPFEMHPDTDIVVSIRDKSAVGALTEGDTVTAIGGWNLLGTEPYEQSALAVRRLNLKPGEKLDVEWVRSGVGKMSGFVTMLDVGGDVRSMPDAAAMRQDHIVRVYRDDSGTPFWGYYNPYNPYGN